MLNDTPVPAVKLNKLPPSATPEIVLLTNALLGIEVRLAPDPLNVVAVIVVPVMANGVVAPMMTLLISPTPVGLMLTWPVPVGDISIWALAPFILIDPSTVQLTPPPAAHWKQAVPLAVLKLPPAELEAS